MASQNKDEEELVRLSFLKNVGIGILIAVIVLILIKFNYQNKIIESKINRLNHKIEIQNAIQERDE